MHLLVLETSSWLWFTTARRSSMVSCRNSISPSSPAGRDLFLTTAGTGVGMSFLQMYLKIPVSFTEFLL